MSASAIFTLAAAAAAAAPAPSGSYTCTSQGMLATFHTVNGWKASDKLQPKNSYQYQTTRVSFLPGNRVAIDLPTNVLNMSGDYYLQTTKDGMVSWVATSGAYCGLVDAECAPMAAFLPNDTGGASLEITAPVVVTLGATKQVGTFEIFYNCEHTS